MWNFIDGPFYRYIHIVNWFKRLFGRGFALHQPIMNPVAQSPSVNLPTEMVIPILLLAARPDFGLINGGRTKRKNSYASALAICRVSRYFRRAVMPIMLECVFLWEDRQVIAFCHALRMQKEYSQQGNDLQIEYKAHICRIWVGRICEPDAESSCAGRCITTEPWINFSILAPVLLAAPSLALDCGSLYLLDRCIKYELLRHPDNSPQRPWSTKNLALSGTIEPSRVRKSTSQIFFASVSHFIILPSRIADEARAKGDGTLNVPEWFKRFPWTFFNTVEAISFPVAWCKFPDVEGQDITGTRVFLMTMTTPPPSSAHALPLLPDSGTTSQIDLESVWNAEPSTAEGVVQAVKTKRGQYRLLVDWEEAWAQQIGDGVRKCTISRGEFVRFLHQLRIPSARVFDRFLDGFRVVHHDHL